MNLLHNSLITGSVMLVNEPLVFIASLSVANSYILLIHILFLTILWLVLMTMVPRGSSIWIFCFQFVELLQKAWERWLLEDVCHCGMGSVVSNAHNTPVNCLSFSYLWIGFKLLTAAPMLCHDGHRLTLWNCKP